MPRLLPFLPSESPRLIGILCALFSVMVWSGWMVLSSYSVRGHLNAFDITALRFATAGLCLLPIALRKGIRIGPWGRWGALWLALLMGAAYNCVAIAGMKLAPTSHASIIQTTVLVTSTIGAVFVLRERFTRLQGAGVMLSVVGILSLVFAGSGGHDDPATLWVGHVLFALGGFMWAIYILSVRAWRADPVQATAAVCVVSALYFLPLYIFVLPHQLSWEHWEEAAFQALYQGVINSIFALLCYNRAVQYLGAASTSAFLPLIPVVASLMAMPLLGEYPDLAEWGGMGLAALGVVMATGIAGRLITRKALP